jgi:hypothetical protein
MSICKKAPCFLEAFFGPARYSNSTAGCIKKKSKKMHFGGQKGKVFLGGYLSLFIDLVG